MITRTNHLLMTIGVVIASIVRFLRATWFVLWQPRLARPEWCDDNGTRRDCDGIPIVILRGSSYQRGFQHGKLLQAELQDFRQTAWRYAVHTSPKRLGVPTWAAVLFVKPLLMILAASYLPKLSGDACAEIQGLADGSGIPLREILVNTVIWEIFAGIPGSSTGPLHCSEFAFDPSQTDIGSILGYNYDVIVGDDRLLVEGFLALFVVVPNSDIAYVTPNTMGSVGLNTAMNAHSVAFGWDNSYLKPGVAKGGNIKPFMLLLRDIALTATCLDDVVKRLSCEQRPEVDISVIVDTHTVGVVELAGRQSAYRTAPVVWSCNRLQALVHLDYLGQGRRLDGRPQRYAMVTEQLPRPITLFDVAAVLRDQQALVGRQIADINNVFSVIYAPQQQLLWLSCSGTPASHNVLRAFDIHGQRYPDADIA